MKTKTWIILFTVLFALSLAASFFLLRPQKSSDFAEILSGGEIIKTVDLRLDQTFDVTTSTGYNIITVKDGKIAVTEASCPDHYCMQRGYCDSGAQIVCLPNRLVIRFLGKQEIDIAVG